jgi:hypothetical protein
MLTTERASHLINPKALAGSNEMWVAAPAGLAVPVLAHRPGSHRLLNIVTCHPAMFRQSVRTRLGIQRAPVRGSDDDNTAAETGAFRV